MDDDACYQAMLTRDRRFDGVFFVGVSTTGVYCRPICPARTPGRSRCQFFQSAARAEQAGYRACFRCRPELAPGNADVDGRSPVAGVDGRSPVAGVDGRSPVAGVDAIDRLVSAAMRRISEGALNDDSVDALAAQLGVSGRHLRRAIEARLGVSPIELAQSRRLALAKQLLQDTSLSLTDIAFAAGFGSVRRFNALFLSKMGSAPSKLRRKQADEDRSGITLRLDHREPYDYEQLLAFLRARAVPGVEMVVHGSYRRVVHLQGATGTIAVRRAPTRPALLLDVAPSLVPVLMPLVARVRRAFDLDARPDVIRRVLGRDETLAPLIRARPGLRLPGAIDPFESAIRALLGQQVSVAAATTLAGRFAARFGARVEGAAGLSHRFPTPAEVARQSVDAIAKIGLPGARAAAIRSFTNAIASGALALDGPHELESFVASLVVLPGIGPWTAHYLAMRSLHLSDAFPAADLGVRKALGATPKEAEARAARWRPFRSYAVMHLWTSLAEATGSETFGGSHDGHDDDDDAHTARNTAAVRARRRALGRLPDGPDRARSRRAANGRAAASL